jgi:hypothetical protein
MATTSRELLEYVWAHRPRVKLNDAADWFSETETRVRDAVRSRQLFGAIRLVGNPPVEYLMPVTNAPNLQEYFDEAQRGGCELDAPLPHASPSQFGRGAPG